MVKAESGGSQKRGFPKCGFGGCSLDSPKPERGYKQTERRYQKPERGYKERNDGTKNWNEGTFAKTTRRILRWHFRRSAGRGILGLFFCFDLTNCRLASTLHVVWPSSPWIRWGLMSMSSTRAWHWQNQSGQSRSQNDKDIWTEFLDGIFGRIFWTDFLTDFWTDFWMDFLDGFAAIKNRNVEAFKSQLQQIALLNFGALRAAHVEEDVGVVLGVHWCEGVVPNQRCDAPPLPLDRKHVNNKRTLLIHTIWEIKAVLRCPDPGFLTFVW